MSHRKKHDLEPLPAKKRLTLKTDAEQQAELAVMHRADMRKRALDDLGDAATTLDWLATQDDDAQRRFAWADAGDLVRIARRHVERFVERARGKA